MSLPFQETQLLVLALHSERMRIEDQIQQWAFSNEWHKLRVNLVTSCTPAIGYGAN